MNNDGAIRPDKTENSTRADRPSNHSLTSRGAPSFVFTLSPFLTIGESSQTADINVYAKSDLFFPLSTLNDYQLISWMSDLKFMRVESYKAECQIQKKAWPKKNLAAKCVVSSLERFQNNRLEPSWPLLRRREIAFGPIETWKTNDDRRATITARPPISRRPWWSGLSYFFPDVTDLWRLYLA